MKTGQKIISAILSIILALVTFAYIEKMGYGDDLQDFYFGGIRDLGQLEKLMAKGYFETIRNIMVLIVIFFIAYVSFFAFFFEIIALVYFVFTSRWKKPQVFISFKNAAPGSIVNTNKIAEDVKANLEKKGFDILLFKFTNTADHDTINFQIQQLLRKADALIAVPDPYNPSYVNSEISCAVNGYKPVYIIKHTADQKLPDTANSGHTVLLLENLEKHKYQPLSYILQYVHGVWHKRLFIIGLPLISFLFPFAFIEDDDGSFLKAILIFGLITAALIFFKVPVLAVLIVIKVIITAIGGFGAYLTINSIFDNIRFQKVIKQSMIHAGNTYQYFKEAEFEKNVLDCVDEVGLQNKDLV